MANYYVDADLATGNNDGTSWANAWQTLQRAVDGTDGTQPAAGDTVWCKGTDTISAAVDFDGNSGDATNGHIKFIGVNAACTNAPPQSTDYGEYFTIDGNNQNINGIMAGNCSRIWLENFKITRCDLVAAMGHTTSYHYSWVLNNVWLHDNAAYGIDAPYYRDMLCYRCRFTSNTSGGVYSPGGNPFFAFCEFKDNTGDGLDGSASAVVCYSCIFHNNSRYGVRTVGFAFCMNCVFDANGTAGVYANITTGESVQLVGCRFTNQSGSGASGCLNNASSEDRVHLFGCYLGNNATPVSGTYDSIPIDGVSTNTLEGTDTDGTNGELLGGYKNIGADDFNLKDTATLRSQAIELD